MPSVSAKQQRFFQAALHDPNFQGKRPPVAVAKEFEESDKGKHFGAQHAARQHQLAMALRGQR